MSEISGLSCSWGDYSKNPSCTHGPTLKFQRHKNGELDEFYACSVCRDRKLCMFYLKASETLPETRKKYWEQERKKFASKYNHRKAFVTLNKIVALQETLRSYCQDCDALIAPEDRGKHKEHKTISGISDRQMTHPSELLKPLDNAKKEAQYLFSSKSTEFIVNCLLQLGAKKVLCVGAPRIHEYLMEKHEDSVSSFLLDFDGRFHNFFGPLSFAWFNLFTCHFYNNEAKETCKDFLTGDAENTYVVCDPPFGGRLEPMSRTIELLSKLHKEQNSLDNNSLKVFFIFPYFMESLIREKATPQGFSGGLRGFSMSDYKVDYENHPLFVSDKQDRKMGSPVRIFTNVPLKELKLPKEEGYKYCKKCSKWVAAENEHCSKCKECTSKDGRTYRHCDYCERCVKPSWKHCDECDRCTLEQHKCGAKPKVAGNCFKCNEYGHTERDCPENATKSPEKKPKLKRKIDKSTVVEKKCKKVKKSKKPSSSKRAE